MSDRIPGDQAVASVLVRVPQSDAFRIFTEEIDQWWRRGLAYRVGRERSVLHLEPKLGGRLFEAFGSESEPRVYESGRITVWTPPERFVLEWRAVNFAPHEKTEVDVCFAPAPSGTLVTVTHRGWSRIRLDHPARHRQDVPRFVANLGRWWGSLATALREYAESSYD